MTGHRSQLILGGLVLLSLASAVVCQTASRLDNEQLRKSYVRAQEEFLNLDPHLERDLLTAAREDVLRRIERSRTAAAAQSQAKIAYYGDLLEKATALGNVLKSATAPLPEDLLVQMSKRRDSLKEEEAAGSKLLESLRAQRESLASAGNAAEAARADVLIHGAAQDLTALRRVREGVEAAMAAADKSMAATKDLLPPLERWKAVQSEERKWYETLYKSAQDQARRWNEYHNDLVQIVRDHDAANSKK